MTKADPKISFCTRSGNRTRTTFKGHRILSPACLPVPPSERGLLYFKQKFPLQEGIFIGAKDEIRTRDPDLGKVVLYQLSYFRVLVSANICRKAILTSFFYFFYLLFYNLLLISKSEIKSSSNPLPEP